MAKPDDCSDFYEALGPKTPQEKAAVIWRMPKVVVTESGDEEGDH